MLWKGGPHKQQRPRYAVPRMYRPGQLASPAMPLSRVLLGRMGNGLRPIPAPSDGREWMGRNGYDIDEIRDLADELERMLAHIRDSRPLIY